MVMFLQYFHNSEDPYTVNVHTFEWAISTRQLKIVPENSDSSGVLRLELIGCNLDGKAYHSSMGLD